ncbi:unnamed protein product [Mucor hiemalis]
MTKKRRSSNHSQGSATSSGGSANSVLAAKTRKSISKSRRSSGVDEKPPSRRTSLAAALNLLSLPAFVEEFSSNASEVHLSYKVRVNRSSKKLDCFFGEPTPLDVCVAEIVKEGLKAMLESKVPLCYFLHHLLEEYSAENLFFFLDAEKFENLCKNTTLSSNEKRYKAQRIFDRFISPTAKLEVNLDDPIRRRITSHINDESQFISDHIFTEAKSAVYVLLETSFNQFLNTSSYNAMLQNCGELTIHYSDGTTGIAINNLLDYISEQETNIKSRDGEEALDSTLLQLNLKYNDLISNSVHGFIQSMFDFEFLSKKSWASLSVAAKKVYEKKR